MTGWLVIASAIVVVWALWLFGNYVADLFETYFDQRRKPRLPEAGRTRPLHKEKERSW